MGAKHALGKLDEPGSTIVPIIGQFLHNKINVQVADGWWPKQGRKVSVIQCVHHARTMLTMMVAEDPGTG
jgi:hypothetical protein